jgi:POT family proton-dependent oligopeptide transporter
MPEITLNSPLPIAPATPAMPASAWRLIVLEFWERFSYYGILAILVLFLTHPSSRGGLGWTDSRALELLAVFAASAFTLPMLGGYVADRWLGARRSVLVGSSVLLLGNVTLAAFAALPSLRSASDPLVTERILYAALGTIALGNGFFKSSLVTLLGSLIRGDEAARDRAFRYYYQAIMLGGLLAALCVGALAESVGWWAGFALAAAGMAISWIMFVAQWNVDGPSAAPAREADIPTDAPSIGRAGLALDVGILCAFLLVIAIAWLQFQGLWLLEVDRWVDRGMGRFTVPASWVLAVNAIAIVVLTQLSGRWWAKLGRLGRPAPGFAVQFATAFALMGVAHLLMAAGFDEPTVGSVSLLWPMGCVLLITFAESLFWPASYNAIHRLSPTRLKSLVMGIWMAMLGIGQYVAHQVARLAETIGFATLSVRIGVAMLVACAVLLAIARLRPSLRQV